MPKVVQLFVKYVDAVNRVVGRFAMYLIFAMLGVLLYSSLMKTFFLPVLWTLERSKLFVTEPARLGTLQKAKK